MQAWDLMMPEEHLVTLVTVPTTGSAAVAAAVRVVVLGGEGVVEDVFKVLLAPMLSPVLVVVDWLALLAWEVEVPPPGNADPEDWLLLPRLLEPEDNEDIDEPLDRVPKLDPPLLLVSLLLPLEEDPAIQLGMSATDMHAQTLHCASYAAQTRCAWHVPFLLMLPHL